MYVKNETLKLISKYTKVSHITKYASELEIYKECTSTSNIIVLTFMRHEENREEFITNMISKELKMKLK